MKPNNMSVTYVRRDACGATKPWLTLGAIRCSAHHYCTEPPCACHLCFEFLQSSLQEFSENEMRQGPHVSVPAYPHIVHIIVAQHRKTHFIHVLCLTDFSASKFVNLTSDHMEQILLKTLSKMTSKMGSNVQANNMSKTKTRGDEIEHDSRNTQETANKSTIEK